MTPDQPAEAQAEHQGRLAGLRRAGGGGGGDPQLCGCGGGLLGAALSGAAGWVVLFLNMGFGSLVGSLVGWYIFGLGWLGELFRFVLVVFWFSHCGRRGKSPELDGGNVAKRACWLNFAGKRTAVVGWSKPSFPSEGGSNPNLLRDQATDGLSARGFARSLAGGCQAGRCGGGLPTVGASTTHGEVRGGRKQIVSEGFWMEK